MHQEGTKGSTVEGGKEIGSATGWRSFTVLELFLPGLSIDASL